MRKVCLVSLTVSTVLALFVPALAWADEKPADQIAKVDKEKEDEYIELFRLFADTLDQIERNYVKDVKRRELLEAAIQGMIGKLDQYSDYITPKELESFKSGVESEFGGVGIQIAIESGQLVIISPLVGTPAYRAGVMAGDKIVEIEGKTTKGIALDEAVRQMKGKVGTSVKLTLVRGDEKLEPMTLTRETVRVETVLGDKRKENDAWDFLLDAEKKLAYIRVTAFGRHTVEELKKALKELTSEGMKGLILDLRNNPGGLLSGAIETSDLFISKGRIVSTEGRNTPKNVWDAHGPGTFEGFPMVVLVNRFSASASEIVSACLQDHDRAVIVGERTWGKGSVQNIIDLENGKSALKLTTAGYHRPNGKNIHRFDGAKESDEWGVKPNDGFEVKLTPAEMGEIATARRLKDIVRKQADAGDKPPEVVDKQLQKALEYLNEKLTPKAVAEEKPKSDETPKSP